MFNEKTMLEILSELEDAEKDESVKLFKELESSTMDP
jgi:hypothetical protein